MATTTGRPAGPGETRPPAPGRALAHAHARSPSDDRAAPSLRDARSGIHASPTHGQPARAPSATYLRLPAARAAEQVAREIRAAIDVLAPLFGLDPARIAVSVTPPAAGAAAGERIVHGAAARDAIRLSGTFDPAEDRWLLVHELVHVRQHRNTVAPDVTKAEAEAVGLAAALRERRTPWLPRRSLPDGHVARESGASGVAAETSAPEVGAPATDATATTPDVAGLEKTLDTYVAANRQGDARLIAGQLDHPWTDTLDGMIENCLRVLSALRFVVARALVRALDPKVRLRLAQLRDTHHTQYPEASVAVLSALTEKELTALSHQEVGPGQHYPGATAAVHGVDPKRLSATSLRALRSVLGRLSVAARVALEQSDRRAVFRELLASGPDTGTDETELKAAIEGERALSALHTGAGSEILADQLTKLLAHGGSDHAQEALLALEPLRDAAPAPSKQASNAPPPSTPALVGLVGMLDTAGAIDGLLDKLDADKRHDDTYGPILRAVLGARSPLPNLALATSLLSYGVLDWAVTDADARFANLLVRCTPIEAQDAWRALDNGKWLGRLEDNVPDFMFTNGEYTGIGSEYVASPGDIPGVPAELLQTYADMLIARWADHDTAAVARGVVRELLGLAGDGTAKPWVTDTTGRPAATDQALRMGVIRRIDARTKLNSIVEALPDDYLFGEQGRIELLDLNQLRDPVHLKQQARGLVPGGYLAWISYTHRDAWLAAQAVRALAPDDQQRFALDNADLWRNIWIGLTPEMRSALPTTLATGRDERLPTREAIRDRLSDRRLWNENSREELRSLIDLAWAADDRAWVFGKSRELRADKIPGLAEVVSHFDLYNETAGRRVFVAERTESSRAPVWGTALAVVGRAIGILLYDAVHDQIDLSGRTMHLQGFDLADLQNIAGGDLGGVTLGDTSRGGRPTGANRINVDVTFDAGFVVKVDLKDLEIKRVNVVLPGKSYRTGQTSIKGLKATAGFSDRHYRQPTYIAVTAESLRVRDMVIVDPAMPFSMAWAIALLALEKLAFSATQDGSTDALGKIDQKLPEGTLPVPIFGPLFELLSNIVALKGGIPGDESLTDLMLLPLSAPFPVSSLVGLAFPTPSPATNLWGLATDGVLRPPRSAAERIGDAVGMLRAFSVSLGSLQVDGISIGAGQQIKALTMTDVNVSVGQSLPAYLNTAISTMQAAQGKLDKGSQQYKELDQRIAALRAQLASVAASPTIDRLREKRKQDPASLTPLERQELELAGDKAKAERRLDELEAKDRWVPGSLSKDERALLVELTTELRSSVGVTAEIGSITLGPLSGSIQSAGVSLKGIHLSARLPNAGLLSYAPGYLDDKSLAEQFVAAGPRIPSVGELAKSSAFSLTIDETQILATDPAQPAVILNAPSIPFAAEIAAQLEAMPDIPGNLPVRRRLRDAHRIVVALERASAIAALPSTPGPERAAAQQQVRELTADAKRLLGTEVGGLKFGRITGELDPASGEIRATLHDAEITNVAGPGFAVDKLTGSIELGLSAKNIKLRPDQLGKADPLTLAGQLAPSFGLRDVTATGISFAGGSIASAKIGHVKGSVQATGGGFRIPDLALDTMVIDEIALGKEGDGVTGKSVTLTGLTMDAEVGLEKTASGTALTRAVIHSLAIASLGGEHLVADMPIGESHIHAELIGGTLEGIGASEVELSHDSDGFALVKGSAEIGSFDHLKYAVVLGALKSRSKTAVAGTLTTATAPVKAKRPTISARYATAGGRKFSLSLAGLQALGTDVSTPDGAVTIRAVTVAAEISGTDAGATATSTLSGLKVGPIDWHAGTARIHGAGPLLARTITVAAAYTPAVPANGRTPAKPAAFDVTDVVITGFEGHDLHYTDAPIDMQLGRDDKSADGQPPLTIGRIHIQPVRKALELSNLSADIGGSLSKSLSVQGHVGLKTMSVELHRDGHLVAHLGGFSGDASIRGDGFAGKIGVEDLGIDTIDVGPDSIRIGGGADNGGIQIGRITLSSIDIDSARMAPQPTQHSPGAGRRRSTDSAGGTHFKLKTLPGGSLDLLDVTASVRLDRWKKDEAHKASDPFKQIAIERLEVDRINLGAFQLDLPDAGVTVVVPARDPGDEPTLHGLKVVGTDSPEFLIKADGALTGKLSVDGIATPLRAKVAKTFAGDVKLSSGLASIDFLAAGGTRIDVANPKLTMSTAAQLADPNTKIRISALGADRLVVDKGVLHATKPFVDGLEYTQNQGARPVVSITLKRAELDKLDYTLKDGAVEIGSLDLQEAFLSLNLNALSPPAKPGDPEPAPSSFDKSTLRPIVDNADGTVKVAMFISADVKGWKDIRLGTPDDPLNIPIAQGKIDLGAMAKTIQDKVHATNIQEGWSLRPWVVNVAADAPEFRLVGSRLELGIWVIRPSRDRSGRPLPGYFIDILSWDLAGADLKAAQTGNALALWAAIFNRHEAPVDPTLSAEEKKQNKEDADRLVNSLELRSLVADLNVTNASPLRLPIHTDTVNGAVTLSKNAVMNLHIGGGIPAADKPLEREGLSPSGLEFTLASVSLDGTDLTIGDNVLKTGRITIKGLRDGTVSFDGVKNPLRLKATITSAHAENIRWYKK